MPLDKLEWLDLEVSTSLPKRIVTLDKYKLYCFDRDSHSHKHRVYDDNYQLNSVIDLEFQILNNLELIQARQKVLLENLYGLYKKLEVRITRIEHNTSLKEIHELLKDIIPVHSAKPKPIETDTLDLLRETKSIQTELKQLVRQIIG